MTLGFEIIDILVNGLQIILLLMNRMHVYIV